MVYIYQILSLLKPCFEIILITIAIYYGYQLIQGTRAVQLIQGLIILFILYFVSQKMNLTVINWLLGKVFTFSIVAFLIIFQPELRRALAQIGRRPFFRLLPKEERMTEILTKALCSLSEKRIGALIAIEREIGLKNYVNTGIKLNARLSHQLLLNVFFPNTPLHDGGVVMRRGELVAAACLFPLSTSTLLDPSLGTRHRAAVGLSEETDALVFVVSEQTGIISSALDGKLARGLDAERLKRILSNVFLASSQRKVTFSLWHEAQ